MSRRRCCSRNWEWWRHEAVVAGRLFCLGGLNVGRRRTGGKIQAVLAKPKILCGRFEQSKQLVGLKRPVVSTGRFCVLAEKGVLWRTLQPFPNTLKLTRDEIVQMQGDRVTQRLDAKQEPTIRTINNVLFALLAGDFAQLEKLFDSDGTIQENNWSVTLKAREPGLAKAIASIAIEGSVYVNKISLQEANGDRTRIVFTAIQSGVEAMSADEAALFERPMTRLWALVVSLFLAHNAYLWLGQRFVPDTDILALLPEDRYEPLSRQAFSFIVDATQQRVMVLIGAEDWARARRAADSYLATLKPHAHLLRPADLGSEENQTDWLALLRPHRVALITGESEAALVSRPASYWVERASGQLYGPIGAFKPVAWQDDPFGLFGEWLQARAQETPVRPRDGRLSVSDGRRQYVVLPLELRLPAFSIATQRAVVPCAGASAPGGATSRAGHRGRYGGRRVTCRGSQRSGAGRNVDDRHGLADRYRAVDLVNVSLRETYPMGDAFDCRRLSRRDFYLHVDFRADSSAHLGIRHQFDRRGARTTASTICVIAALLEAVDSWRLLRQLLPALVLTLVTTLIGYLALALTPFPGLRQMALFSVAGLVCAWLTVAIWFPTMVRPDSLKGARPIPWLTRTLTRWPLLRDECADAIGGRGIRDSWPLTACRIYACRTISGFCKTHPGG